MTMKNTAQHHAPLHHDDTSTQTHGCRHTNPDICAKNMMQGICAFANTDGTCYSPPASWPKQYKKLKADASNTTVQ